MIPRPFFFVFLVGLMFLGLKITYALITRNVLIASLRRVREVLCPLVIIAGQMMAQS